MDRNPETVRQVLRSWLANEVLTPQITRNGWSGLAADKQGQQRNRDGIVNLSNLSRKAPAGWCGASEDYACAATPVIAAQV